MANSSLRGSRDCNCKREEERTAKMHGIWRSAPSEIFAVIWMWTWQFIYLSTITYFHLLHHDRVVIPHRCTGHNLERIYSASRKCCEKFLHAVLPDPTCKMCKIWFRSMQFMINRQWPNGISSPGRYLSWYLILPHIGSFGSWGL